MRVSSSESDDSSTFQIPLRTKLTPSTVGHKAPSQLYRTTSMSTRTLSANEPTRSSSDSEKKDAAALTESLSRDPYPHTYAEEDLFEEGAVDAVYQAKARVLNAAVREIGMGKYQVCGSVHNLSESDRVLTCQTQWCLFVVAGFGWFSYVAAVGLSFPFAS